MSPHNGENVVNVVNNTNENGRNGKSTIDPFLNTANPSIVGNSVTTTPLTITHGFIIKEELEKLLDQKNKSLNFLGFDLKLLYFARVVKVCVQGMFDEYRRIWKTYLFLLLPL
ncbi:H0502G05.11 protein, putative [Theobroma cacao]|uniref:H0502G05.11 protein, putative n=1 Tax=Theobroma cacao TaxID=3641 RepID=A0A061GAV3_THECC|nr:H0502G05.11 protein, putative [Theobroma cacao]